MALSITREKLGSQRNAILPVAEHTHTAGLRACLA